MIDSELNHYAYKQKKEEPKPVIVEKVEVKEEPKIETPKPQTKKFSFKKNK